MAFGLAHFQQYDTRSTGEEIRKIENMPEIASNAAIAAKAKSKTRSIVSAVTVWSGLALITDFVGQITFSKI